MVHLPTALFSLSYIRDSSNRCSHYAPLRGATVVTRTVTEGAAEFQSTRPMRGATITYTAVPASSWNFNPRAPCGARRQWRYTGVYRCHFNPRAPRGARLALMGNMGVELFISIHARLSGSDRGGAGISIHAPREGRDPPAPELVLCGGGLFQSTRPARGATAKVNKFLCTFLQKRHGFQIFLCKTLPFKAFCRLQIGKNFSICGANRCGNFCELLLRTIRSSVLPEGRSACSQNAQFYSHTFSRDNRNADCLFPDP